MATIKQEQVIPKIVENRGNISKSMRQVGYSPATAKNPKNLTESKGFKTLLAQIDDKTLLDRLYEIATSEDKRSSMEAIKTILIGLKGYGAEQKFKVTQYEGELKDLINKETKEA